jgi:hypothetical protein
MHKDQYQKQEAPEPTRHGLFFETSCGKKAENKSETQ